MKIKRVLQGTALTALAAAAWMGAGSTDASAAISADDISYYGGTELDINSPGAKEIVVGIAKVDKSNNAKVSAWDVYDGSSATVDLSKVNVTKEAYIAVKTNANEAPIFVKIDAAAKKVKATLNAGTREVTFEDDKKAKIAVDKIWGEFDCEEEKAFILERYQYQGAVLYYGMNGVGYEGEDKKVGEITDKTDDKKNGKKVTLVTVGKFPSKEAKLNVPKQANGPAVPVDYAKGTIKVKKGVEVRVVGSGISDATSNAAFTDKTLSVSDFFSATFGNANENDGTLEVRVAAKTEGKGKAASKWTRAAIEKPKTIAASAASVVTASAVTSKITGDAVSEGAIDLQYTAKKSGADKGKADGGLAITNKSAYSVDVVESATAPKADDKGKIAGMKTIKSTKNTTIKSLSDGKIVWVRVSGDKSTKTWASNWVQLHTVALPK